MKKAEFPSNEVDRLEDVKSFELLDTEEEKEYDSLTKLCAELTDSPISLITLLDDKRNWFKSHHGTELKEDDRERSFCGHAILTPNEPFIIPNTLKDERFFDNPLVTGINKIKFYAGLPIISKDGHPLGTLCIMDRKAKELSEKQIGILTVLANQVAILMEHHKKEKQLKFLNDELIEINKTLNLFAKSTAHDLRSPVVNIREMVRIYEKSFKVDLSDKQKEIFGYIRESANQIKNLVEGTLSHSNSISILAHKRKELLITEVVEYAQTLVDSKKKHKITTNYSTEIIRSNEVALKRILINLFSNSIKYTDKKAVEIRVDLNRDSENYILSVSDNGPGIPKDYHDKIFEIFERGENAKSSKEGVGIGLATVKKLVEGMKGSIRVENNERQGVSFIMQLPI